MEKNFNQIIEDELDKFAKDNWCVPNELGTRSKKTKEAFIQYLKDNPNQRFWQSIRNFAGVNFVMIIPNGDLDGGETFDTFHFEELDK